MKRAIVTGAAGFLGGWLVRELLNNGIAVVAVIHRDRSRECVLPTSDRLQAVNCSMEDYDRLPQLVSSETETVFYHAAWDGVYGPRRSDPSVQLKNVLASQNAVKAAAQLHCDTFVGIGSIMEFEAIAAAEQNGILPSKAYMYGEAKHFAHLLSKAAAAECGIRHVWPILTNLYGEYDTSTRFISTTLHKIICKESLEFTEGKQIYDFTHVQDAARALRLLGESGQAFHSYVVGSGQPRPLRQFVEELGAVLAPDQPLRFGSVPYSGIQLLPEVFSTEKLREDTGFIPQISFAEGIRRTMTWMQKEYEK